MAYSNQPRTSCKVHTGGVGGAVGLLGGAVGGAGEGLGEPAAGGGAGEGVLLGGGCTTPLDAMRMSAYSSRHSMTGSIIR